MILTSLMVSLGSPLRDAAATSDLANNLLVVMSVPESTKTCVYFTDKNVGGRAIQCGDSDLQPRAKEYLGLTRSTTWNVASGGLVEGASHRDLLIFPLSGRITAIPLAEVERIVPMAELTLPPGLPAALAGVLNLAGEAIPVLRLDRLFDLPEQSTGLYSALVILRGETPMAILADRVSEIMRVPETAFLPV